ncbi:MAG TPA: PAS domain S-box protein [Burkholderiaceae bacterium]|nr:PAS domain S-box protein [Burkholderiaceae bacterium]
MALAVRPPLADWLGETLAFVVLCATVAVAVALVGIGLSARRERNESGQCAGAAFEAQRAAPQHGGEKIAAAGLLAAIVETSDDAIVSKSLDGVIQTWNAAAQRVFGYTAEQAVGQHISLIIPPDRLAEEDLIMQSLRAGTRVDHYETVRVRSDGQLIPISLSISPIRDDAGSVVGAFKIARDISARKHAEAQLRERDERLRIATRTGKLGIWEWDAATDRVSWTDSLYSIHGVAPEDFDGTFAGFMRLVHADDRDHVTRTLQGCLKVGRACELEFRAVKQDGQVVWVYSTALTVQDEGAHHRMIGATLDITDRRRAEEAMKLADRRKDEFLATLAHELRNPLAPIWTAAQVLKLKGAADPDLHWSSEVIDRQTRHMVRLLEDLLDVSRISQNKLELRKEPVELAAVVRAAIETSQPLIDSAQHELSVQLPADPIELHGDPVRLAQVFSNLLNNAAKYMRHGGRIVVRAERQGDRVTVAVRDQGVGIAPEMLPRVFEIFAQGAPAEHRAQDGLGIGLSLARALVHMHGGTIEAHSEGQGKGSEFLMSLPLAVSGVPSTSAGATSRREAEHKRRLLIVDDLKDSADSLAALMRIKGHEAHTAYEGESAVALAAKLRPDVILLDIGLPKRNGYEVCRLVRDLPGGDSIFIVALTGWGQPRDRRCTEEAGFDWHLVKPVDGEMLADLLASLPAMRRSLRASQDSG